MTTVPSQVELAIAAVVLNALWEGALIVAIVWLGLRFASNLGAATHYAIWLSTVVALVAVPIFTVFSPSREFASQTFRASIATTVPAREPAAVSRPVRSDVAEARVGNRVRGESAREPVPSAPAKQAIEIPQVTAIAVTIVWLFCAFARAIRLVRDCLRLAAIRRHARPWSTVHEIPILLCAHVHVPLAIGFRHRAIVLPAQLVEDFGSEDIEAIVIHELAHLRRYDVWTNLVARIAEVIGASNPATWFAMRQLSTEREIACDDWVVARKGTGNAFARTLAALANAAEVRAPIAAPSVLGSRHAIVGRIERLLDARPRRLRYSRPILGGSLMLLALIAIFAQTFAPALAYEPAPLDSAQAATTVSPATTDARSCAVPNRGIALMYLGGKNRNAKGTLPMNFELPPAGTQSNADGRLNTTYELTVDATGMVVRAAVLAAPNVAGLKAHLTRVLSQSTYAPAFRNCVPFATTIRTSTHVRLPEPNTRTVITPIYAATASAASPTSCKIPTVTLARYRPGFVSPTPYTHMLPEFPSSEKSIDVDTSYVTTLRIAVNGSTATRATISQSSGRAAFDEAALAAARNATYPPLSSTCQAPPAYQWRTTFAYQAFP